MGISTVAVFSDADGGALHVCMADEAVDIGPSQVAESYVIGARTILAARKAGADAIHPGCGFEAGSQVQVGALAWTSPETMVDVGSGRLPGRKAIENV